MSKELNKRDERIKKMFTHAVNELGATVPNNKRDGNILSFSFDEIEPSAIYRNKHGHIHFMHKFYDVNTNKFHQGIAYFAGERIDLMSSLMPVCVLGLGALNAVEPLKQAASLTVNSNDESDNHCYGNDADYHPSQVVSHNEDITYVLQDSIVGSVAGNAPMSLFNIEVGLPHRLRIRIHWGQKLISLSYDKNIVAALDAGEFNIVRVFELISDLFRKLNGILEHEGVALSTSEITATSNKLTQYRNRAIHRTYMFADTVVTRH